MHLESIAFNMVGTFVDMAADSPVPVISGTHSPSTFPSTHQENPLKAYIFSPPQQVLIPPKDLASRLHKESDNTRSVMDKVQYRVQWEKHQEMQRKKEEEQKEKERGKNEWK